MSIYRVTDLSGGRSYRVRWGMRMIDQGVFFILTEKPRRGGGSGGF